MHLVAFGQPFVAIQCVLHKCHIWIWLGIGNALGGHKEYFW